MFCITIKARNIMILRYVIVKFCLLKFTLAVFMEAIINLGYLLLSYLHNNETNPINKISNCFPFSLCIIYTEFDICYVVLIAIN